MTSSCPHDPRRLLHCLLAMLLAAMPAIAVAGDDGQDWSGHMRQNRPWQALRMLETDAGLRQVAAQVAVFVGDERPACTQRPSAPPEVPEGAGYRDALEVIAEAAGEARVVMLNESHFRRAHRLFLGQVIGMLHGLGFDALAAETFAAQAPSSLADGVPDVGTGFYTADPAFAAALRRAHALGWTFVPYEAEDAADRDGREAGQAAALAQWIASNPGRRLLVYAGGSHVSEDPEAGWMAARFAALTGLDPLTIGQGPTACPDTTANWALDAAVPVATMRDDASPGAPHVDIVVLHPPSAIAAAEATRGVSARLCVPPLAEATLLRAFAEDNADDAIPRDQAVVEAGAGDVLLRLDSGRYRIVREGLRASEPLGYAIVAPEPAAGCIHPLPE